jgi:hypothetical protein
MVEERLIACSLDEEGQRLRAGEFGELMREAAGPPMRAGHTVEVTFANGPGMRRRVEDLTAREKECCPFFDFSIREEEGMLVLTVDVPDEAAGILDSLFVA